MDCPDQYNTLAPEAVALFQNGTIKDVPTLMMYSHICRGDLSLRNDDGQAFHDPEHNGFGWGGDRKWVEKKLRPLIKAGLVELTKLRDCRDGKYTSWYFHKKGTDTRDLVDASCYATVWKFFVIKHVVGLPDGFDRNGTYGKFELKKDLTTDNHPYSFRYDGAPNNLLWDHEKAGKTKGTLQSFFGKSLPKDDYEHRYEDFGKMVHDMWQYLVREGTNENFSSPATTTDHLYRVLDESAWNG